jgi:D-arabinose 1-dehydrogenase-like Zn-dependent alcohol dehydrogenase
MKVEPEIQEFKLKQANQSLVELNSGKIRGFKVLIMEGQTTGVPR